MLSILFACLALIVLTVAIHYEVLRQIGSYLPRVEVRPRAKLIVAVLGLFVAHLLEIAAFGFVYFGLSQWADVGALSSVGHVTITDAMYFSVSTYTSLGYGDIVPTGPIRLVAGIEALDGLLLIGWSASFLYITMERYWPGARSRTP